MSKKSWLTYFSAILCVELPQVQYIDLSEIVLVVKAVVIVTGVHLKLINAFCGQSLFIIVFFILYNTFLTAFYIVDIYGPHPWQTSRRKVLSSTPNGIQKHTTALLVPSSRCSRDIQCMWWPGFHMKCSSPWQEHPLVSLLVEHPRS